MLFFKSDECFLQAAETALTKISKRKFTRKTPKIRKKSVSDDEEDPTQVIVLYRIKQTLKRNLALCCGKEYTDIDQ